MKYRQGDKVRVKSREYFENIGFGNTGGCIDPTNKSLVYFEKEMLVFCDKILSIDHIAEVSRGCNEYYYTSDDSGGWGFVDWMLEDVSTNSNITKHQIVRRKFSKISSIIY